MKNYFILLFIGLTLNNCRSKINPNDMQIFESNLDYKEEKYKFILGDGNDLFLFGENQGVINDFRTKKIVIKRAELNNLSNWESFIDDSILGRCRSISQTEENIFILVQEYQHKQNPHFSRHKLYKVNKFNKSFELLYEWKEGNFFVHSMNFSSEKKGVILMRVSGNPLEYKILKTNNGGKEWYAHDLNRPIIFAKYINQKVYFLSYENSLEYSIIYSFDLKTNNLEAKKFDLDIFDFHIGKNDVCWILGKDPLVNNRVLLKRFDKEKSEIIKSFGDLKFSQGTIYSYDNLIIVTGKEIDKNMLGGFGGSFQKVYISEDYGEKWNDVKKQNKLSNITPYMFLRNEKMIGYIGYGKILVYDFMISAK